MRPIGIGLVAALVLAIMAPAGVSLAQKKAAGQAEKERAQGMAEAPPLAQSLGIACSIVDARFMGKAENKKEKTSTSYYEIDCDKGVGFVIQAATNQKPVAFSCIEANTPAEAGKPAALPCTLAGNANPEAELTAPLAKANIQCTPEKVRGIGQSATSSYIEVLCQGGAGYIVVASTPLDLNKPVTAQNCLSYDEGDGNIKCALADKASRIAIVDRYVAESKNGCQVKDRRFIGTSTEGSNYFEASCQDGKGYIYKVDSKGALNQTYECAKAQGILGGCTLTDAREAETAQAGLYTRLAKAAGFNCDVSKYAIFPAAAGKDAVELVCADGNGGVGVFETGGKGAVYDCGRALVAGYRCGLNKPEAGYAALTQDLRKFDQKTCTVSASRLAAKTTKGTILVEVACSDGFKGYMIEYNTSPVAAVGATGCAFAGGCKLPGNT